MKKKFVIINIIFLFSLTAFSQSDTTAFRKWETHISVGYTIGGTTPIPLPSEIRKINSYRPGANLLLAVDFTRWFNSEWGITTGIGIGTQGMSISADVKYWNTDLVVGDGESTGRFTGTGRWMLPPVRPWFLTARRPWNPFLWRRMISASRTLPGTSCTAGS